MGSAISEEQLEMMREKTQKIQKVVFVISFIIFLFLLFLVYVASGHIQDASAFDIIKLLIVAVALAFGIFVLLWMIIVKSTYDKFNEAYKTKYVLYTISQIDGFKDLEFMPKSGFSWMDIKNAGIVNCGQERYYESEDLLSGTYENVGFKISDVTTKKVVRRDDDDRVEEIFKGQVMCLHRFDDFKTSDGYLQIFENQFLSGMAGWKAEHHIETEDEAFNKRFSIYTDDEHNAYYILTPQRMEKIMRFADLVDSQVSLVFHDKELFVAAKRDSMFDADMSVPVKEQTTKITEDAVFIQKVKEILVEE